MKYAFLQYVEAGHDFPVLSLGAPGKEDAIATGAFAGGIDLLPTTTAVSIRRGGGAPVVLDGPLIDMPDQICGVQVFDCESLDEAIAIACRLLEATPWGGYELRSICGDVTGPKLNFARFKGPPAAETA